MSILRGILVFLSVVILLFSIGFAPANGWGAFLARSDHQIDIPDIQFLFLYFVPFGLAVLAHILLSPDSTAGALTAISSNTPVIRQVHPIDNPKYNVFSRWTWTIREILFASVLIFVNILWFTGPVAGRFVKNVQTGVTPVFSFSAFINTGGRKAGTAGMWNAALAIFLAIRENHMIKALLGNHAGQFHTAIRFHVGTGYAAGFPSLVFNVPLLYFIWDRISPRLKIKRSVKIRANKVGKSVIRIVVPLSSGYFNSSGYAPGDWLNIQIPSISKIQWHPFSTTSYYPESPNHITLMVAVRGHWTKKLLKHVEESPTDILNANVDGIFGSRSNSYLSHDILVLAGGGTGIEALVPYLKHYTRIRTSGIIHFIWVARDISSAASHISLVNELKSLVNTGSNIVVHLHLTQEIQTQFSRSPEEYKFGNFIEINTRIKSDEKFSKTKISNELNFDNREFALSKTLVNGSCQRDGRTKSKLLALVVAIGIFGFGIGLYCLGRILMFSYNAKQCADLMAYKFTGWAHFFCWYYYYLAPVTYAISGATFAGLLLTFIIERVLKLQQTSIEADIGNLYQSNSQEEYEKTIAVVKELSFIIGRPQWRQIFEEIEKNAEKSNSVGVMGAGPEGILKDIQSQVVAKPNFVFYRESWKV
ncbi:hypothetical protein HK096_009920 [Nowakowskiella sp. JEL0078]|nr:hypothetical protein HK096_009920 [Nowakowskiella sp. JEL0078]